jgi:hypothetical protein
MESNRCTVAHVRDTALNPSPARPERVTLLCAECRARHRNRRPGTLGYVHYGPEGTVSVIVVRRGGQRDGYSLQRRTGAGHSPTRTIFRKLRPDERSVLMECPACPAAPRKRRADVRRETDAAREAGLEYIAVSSARRTIN